MHLVAFRIVFIISALWVLVSCGLICLDRPVEVRGQLREVGSFLPLLCGFQEIVWRVQQEPLPAEPSC